MRKGIKIINRTDNPKQETTKQQNNKTENPTMQTITIDNLIQTVQEMSGSTFINMDYISNPKPLKKSRITGEPTPEDVAECEKHNGMGGMIGISYSNCVNNQRSRENKEMDFEPCPLQSWQKRDNNIIRHNKTGKAYLPVMVQNSKNNNPVYIGKYGNVLNYEDIKEYLPQKSKSKRQGTEKEIIWRTIAFDSIRKIRMFNEEYAIVESENKVEQKKKKVKEKIAVS
jgi:hypothetical protein